MYKYRLHQVDGIFFELIETPKNRAYKVQILDGEKILYETSLSSNMWCKYDRKYLSDYIIKIYDGDILVYEISMLKELKGKKVFISYESSSLGDGLAWIAYCEEFRKKYECQVVVSTFHNFLYEKAYPNLNFVPRGTRVDNIAAMYHLGWFYDTSKEPEHPATIPLQKSASNILNLEFKEIKPEIHFEVSERPMDNKYVAISTRSTAQCKHWYFWSELVQMLIQSGYQVVELSKEYDKIDGVIYPDEKDLDSVINYLYHSEFYIGLSSGISWLSWAVGKKVYMISNFTESNHEFETNCVRINNTKVCNSCWNNPVFKFNKGDWWWCPEHEHTERQFECHKSISAQDVFSKLNLLPH
jgi:autotransporter strand-loop-strand O-heptosyltransferase